MIARRRNRFARWAGNCASGSAARQRSYTSSSGSSSPRTWRTGKSTKNGGFCGFGDSTAAMAIIAMG